MSMKTYTGSCHCGQVRYEVDLDLSEGTGKCNCSYCTKVRNWSVITKPANFRMISGESELSYYRFSPESVVQHPFCKHCGIRPFGKGNIPEIGGEYVSIQVGCLDDAKPEELLGGPVKYFDGRNNNWWNAPAETRHL